MGQVVDTETAKEFMQETLQVVDTDELAKICTDVEDKSAWFRKTLAPDALPELDKEIFSQILRRVFSARGKRRQALQSFGVERMREWIADLLHGDDGVEPRLQRFLDRLEGLDDHTRMDFASELMHFSNPEQYWLWTRWLWDPKNRTGALPLVTTAAYDLGGENPSESYMRVGKAIAFVHEVGDAAGFQKISKSIFGTDVFLSCVYVIYTYTVLRMRMTNEFNKVVPQLPEFSRRLLGVHRRKAG